MFWRMGYYIAEPRYEFYLQVVEVRISKIFHGTYSSIKLLASRKRLFTNQQLKY